MSSRHLFSSLALRPSAQLFRAEQVRCLHTPKLAVPRPIPRPIPIVPDPPTFLRLIGRDLTQYADKFPTWEALFSLTSPQLKEMGVEPARTRRYLLDWLRRYREGKFGPGGDFKHIQDGKAILAIHHDIKTDRKKVVNIPPGGTVPEELSEADRVRDYRVHGAKRISGPYATPAGNGIAQVNIVDGMWEIRQGQKVDGGERRRPEFRFKKRIADRKAQKEAEMAQ